MLAKYSGVCKVTGQKITAGVTEIEKVNGQWQVKQQKAQKIDDGRKPAGATISMAWSNSVQDRYGDEYLKHYASFGDDDGEPVGKVWTFSSRDKAIEYAETLQRQYDLADVLNETMW